jgi:hypothetical protein
MVLFTISGSTVETSTTSSLHNEKLLIGNPGENGDDSNNLSSLTENDNINNNNY